MIFAPKPFDYLQPFSGARVAIVVLLKFDAVFFRLVGPPRRNHVEREPAAAADAIDVGGLLGEQRRLMKGRAHSDHQLQTFSNRREGRRRGPRVERWRFDAFDVVEIQLGDQRQIETNLFAAPREAAVVFPGRLHPFVIDVS